MGRLRSATYLRELDAVVNANIPWDALADKTVTLSGATGMIGAFLIDVLMRKNAQDGLGCRVVALGRSFGKARARLPYLDSPLFSFEEMDVSERGATPSGRADYVLHLASSTHPRAYASSPIETIAANTDGLKNLLEYASSCGARLLFASSVEVYGENRGDVERFCEDYCGYIDCNTLRACYTESKRLGEAMCQAYRTQRGVEAVIARIARVYGPTLLADDSKALSQFIHRALAGKDVVLKSAGTQRYSYLHVADAVGGLLHVLLNGEDGEAYNLADPASDTSLRDLASLVADVAGVQVTFDTPDAQEAVGYSKATLALMDGSKAHALGWTPCFTLNQGVAETLSILKEMGT
ncbi:MAG: NAD-dependent epimerase/dehydratase family protein [Eggerthellaceae bacterium]|nr:NAD-dependent epimerase/dehydratase family protein [Eggerthellaceae bacterium]